MPTLSRHSEILCLGLLLLYHSYLEQYALLHLVIFLPDPHFGIFLSESNLSMFLSGLHLGIFLPDPDLGTFLSD